MQHHEFAQPQSLISAPHSNHTRIPLRACLVVAFTCLWSVSLHAAEPYEEFLSALKARGYTDAAMFYLDQIEQDPQSPEALREAILYERGQILLLTARQQQSAESQRRQLDQAIRMFESFTQTHPNHPLAGQANTARGQIFVSRARVEIWESERPSSTANKSRLLETARAQIAQAQQIFEAARQNHEAAFREFPGFIAPDQTELLANRDKAAERYIRSRIDLAECLYWNAQTYEKGSEARKEALKTAATAFEEIYLEFRSQAGGLYARLYQGKCYQEQGDIEGLRTALGYYSDLLKQSDTDQNVRDIRDLALRFRLIGLNDPQRSDFALVIDEAEYWLREAKDRARTEVGLGIQMELCRAQELLAGTEGVPAERRRNLLTQALNRARTINRFGGEQKNPSTAMIQRILVALNRNTTDPTDFDSAYTLASDLHQQVVTLDGEVRSLLAQGNVTESNARQQALQAAAGEMSRMYDVALGFATPATPALMTDTARLRLAYGYLVQKKSLDAAIIAEDQMLRGKGESEERAKEAAFLMMAAYEQAYSEAPSNNREFEQRLLLATANQITARWPGTDRADDALNTVAKVYWNQDDLLTAAEWWQKIPATSARYSDAQIKAGKAYWRQYALSTRTPEATRPEIQQLNAWKNTAIQLLVTGIRDAEQNTPESVPLNGEVVGAKIVLVGIRNLDGNFQGPLPDGSAGARELLEDGPHSIMKEVTPPEGADWSQDPTQPKSREMASLAYQQLLRTQIGLNAFEAANAARLKLEEVAAGGDQSALTQVFVEFGQELQRELERLRASNEMTRMNEVRNGFERFLQDLLNREEGQSFQSLLWIGETLSSLGEGSEDDEQRAAEFFKLATGAYQRILDQASSNPDFATEPQLKACQLRMVNSLQNQQEFTRAEEILLGVLRTSVNIPEVQFAAARFYQSWGASTRDAAKFQIALYGQAQPIQIWGWTRTAQILQQSLTQKKEARAESLYFDSRFELAQAELQFGQASTTPQDQTLHFDRAKSNIIAFQRISSRWPDDQYLRFNELYQEIMTASGQPAEELPREYISPQLQPAPQVAGTSPGNTPSTGAHNGNAASTPMTGPLTGPSKSSEESSTPLWMFGGLLIACLAGTGYWFWRESQKKPSRRRRSGSRSGPSSASNSAAADQAFGMGASFGEPFTASTAKSEAAPNRNPVTSPSTTPRVAEPQTTAQPVADGQRRPSTSAPPPATKTGVNPAANPGTAARPRPASPATGAHPQGVPPASVIKPGLRKPALKEVIENVATPPATGRPRPSAPRPTTPGTSTPQGASPTTGGTPKAAVSRPDASRPAASRPVSPRPATTQPRQQTPSATRPPATGSTGSSGSSASPTTRPPGKATGQPNQGDAPPDRPRPQRPTPPAAE